MPVSYRCSRRAAGVAQPGSGSRRTSAAGLALCLALASAAVAETPGTAIETALLGDPGAPARLLLAHWPAAGWIVRQNGRLAEIRFPGAFLDIDLTGVEDAFPATILEGIESAMTPDGTVLSLTLGCPCSLAVTGDGEARLAIDVVGADLTAGPVLRARAVAPVQAPLPPVREPVAPRSGAPEAPASGPAVQQDPDLARMRERLLRDLERAAAAGLITLEGTRPAAEPEAAATDRVGATQRAAPDDAPPRERAAQAPDTRADQSGAGRVATPPPEPTAPARTASAQTASARTAPEPAPGTLSTQVGSAAFAEAEPAATPHGQETGPWSGLASALAVPPEGPACLPDHLVGLPAPMPANLFSQTVAELNRHLLGEFDRPDPGIALELASHLLAHGFGVEALEVLASFAPRQPGTPALAALALVLEDEALPLGHALSASGCGGAHAVWHALATPRSDGRERALAEAIGARRALEAMPEPIRSAFAVRLGLAATETGNLGWAAEFRSVARRGDRADRPHTARRMLLDAAIARANGDVTEALDLLRTVWADGGEAGAEAMLALAQMVSDGALPDAGDTHALRLDLGALARAERGTPLGERASLAEADLAFLALGRRAAVDLLALARTEGRIFPAAEARALAGLATRSDPDAGGAPLALLHEQDPGRFANALSEPGMRAALARSFAEIGLPERGEAVLRPGDLADDDLVASLARAHLAGGRPDDAARLAALLPDTPVRAEIEAGALAAGGDPAAALGRLVAAGAGTARERARLAWAAENWQAAAEALEDIAADGTDPAALARLGIARERAGEPGTGDGPGPAPDSGLAGAAANPAFVPTAAGVDALLDMLRDETGAMKEMLENG